jgi:hypothetical protein
MKLTAASLAAQSAEAFDGSPEVAGELEGFVRYVLSKDGNILLVADTKADPEGGDKAKLARFTWDKLPDGCGKGAKVKLSGIQFVKKVGRDYNGKTYYDMVYSFAACEVLEAGAARSGFGGKPGGGWQPRSPEERASIEAQNIMTSSVQFGVATFNQASLAGADKPLDIALAATETAFDRLWAKLQKAKATATPQRQPQEPASASQPAGQATRTAGGAGTDSQKPSAPNGGNRGAFAASLNEAGQEVAKKIGALVVEMFGKEESPKALRNLTEWLDDNGQIKPGMESVAKITSERQAKAIMCTVGPLHHWWKTAGATNQARLADTVLKAGGDPATLGDDLKALMADDFGGEGATGSGGDFEVLSPFGMPAEEWTLFVSQAQEASGESDVDAVVGLIDKTAMRLFTGGKYKPLKAKFLSEEAVAAVLAELRK